PVFAIRAPRCALTVLWPRWRPAGFAVLAGATATAEPRALTGRREDAARVIPASRMHLPRVGDSLCGRSGSPVRGGGAGAGPTRAHSGHAAAPAVRGRVTGARGT